MLPAEVYDGEIDHPEFPSPLSESTRPTVFSLSVT